MEIIQFFIDLLRDPRDFIAQWITDLGPIWVYTPLFIIIFVETGLVVTPFLPGDSLLFAAGVFAAPGGGLNVFALIILLSLAAVLGNTSNYWIGRKVGQAIIDSGRVKALTPERIAKTQKMFDKYGLLAVVLTRFFPIIRTFAPFLAGVGGMHFGRFTIFNIIGGVLWVSLFTLLGYFFGGIPVVQEHFELIIILIIVISFIPTVAGVIRASMNKRRAAKAEAGEKVADAEGALNANDASEQGAPNVDDADVSKPADSAAVETAVIAETTVIAETKAIAGSPKKGSANKVSKEDKA